MKPVHVLIVLALVGVAALLYSLSGGGDPARDGRRSGRVHDEVERSEKSESASREGAKLAAFSATGSHELEIRFAMHDGSPVNAAELTIVDPLGNTAMHEGLGQNIVLPSTAPGVYRFMVRQGNAVGAKIVTLSEPQETHTIVLHEAIRVSGRVVDQSNRPIVGALVEGVRGTPKAFGLGLVEILRRVGNPQSHWKMSRLWGHWFISTPPPSPFHVARHSLEA